MSDLPKIAMQRLQTNSAAAGTHPDPNLISAFVENLLPPESRVQIAQHLAQCGGCREVLFLSSLDPAATPPAAAFAPSKWSTWPVLRWGAAMAAVVVVAAAIGLRHQSDKALPSSGAVQTTDALMVREKASPAEVRDEKPQTTTSAANPTAGKTLNQDSGRHAEGRNLNELKKESSRSDSPMSAERSGAAAGSSPVEARQVVPGRAKDAVTGPEVGGATAGLAEAMAARPRSALIPPMVPPRWTLTSDGILQRSIDFGKSWQTVQVATQGSFRALAASGKDIWVGGLKGALYHSADAGQDWTQVQPVADGRALSDDIIGVEFPDSLHGRLTTASKEVWITEDGGQSWQKP